MSEMIKIGICDDIKYLAEYFSDKLQEETDFEVVGIADNSESCLELVKQAKPDILLLDIQMESGDSGITLIPEIKAQSPATKIILLTIHEEDEYIIRGYSQGISNYMVKTAPISKIITTIRMVHTGNSVYMDPRFANVILNEYDKIKTKHISTMYVINLISRLTKSELEILRALYDGDSYEELARKRSVEEMTIRSQVSRILKKFNARNMRSLIEELKELKIFELLNFRDMDMPE